MASNLLQARGHAGGSRKAHTPKSSPKDSSLSDLKKAVRNWEQLGLAGAMRSHRTPWLAWLSLQTIWLMPSHSWESESVLLSIHARIQTGRTEGAQLLFCPSNRRLALPSSLSWEKYRPKKSSLLGVQPFLAPLECSSLSSCTKSSLVGGSETSIWRQLLECQRGSQVSGSPRPPSFRSGFPPCLTDPGLWLQL